MFRIVESPKQETFGEDKLQILFLSVDLAPRIWQKSERHKRDLTKRCPLAKN